MHHRRICVILTNTTTLKEGGGGQQAEIDTSRTGFDIRSVAYLWQEFKTKHQMQVDVLTPAGGKAEMDPNILECSKNDKVVKEFLQDRANLDPFQSTKAIRDAAKSTKPQDYDVIVLPGGHGALIDFPHNQDLTNFLTKALCAETTTAQGKTTGPILATVGHGLAAFLPVKIRTGESATATETPFLKNRHVTCFTKEEEQKFGYEKVVPFILEEKVREMGARIEKTSPMGSKVVVEELSKTGIWEATTGSSAGGATRTTCPALITAQNPMSAEEWVKKISEYMKM